MARITELLNSSAVALALGVASRTGLLRVMREPATLEAIASSAKLNARYVEDSIAYTLIKP